MKFFDLFKRKKKNEPKILIRSSSPNCPVRSVFVEEYNNCSYFYLTQNDGTGQDNIIRPCWISNHHKAPEDFEFDVMKNGMPSMLPAQYCKFPEGTERLNPDHLEIVWFEEGDGAALFYKEEIICVIPGWADSVALPGYARDCLEENMLAWPFFPAENVLTTRVIKAKEFWDGWDENSWPKIQTEYLDILEQQFGEPIKYYAIDGNEWPPKALVRFEVNEITYLITIGVSLRPQPTVEMYSEVPDELRRFELALAINTTLLNENEKDILKFISAQTNIPWNHHTWLGHGHTISTGGAFSIINSFPYLVCVNAHKLSVLPQIEFPPYRGDRINFLWLLPITDEEKEFLKSEDVIKLFKKRSKDKKDFWVF